jgi:PAS domain S-box-containing protein
MNRDQIDRHDQAPQGSHPEIFAQAQHLAQVGHWDLDLARNHLWWSDEVYRIFGCQPQSFAATYEAFLSFVHPEDRTLVDHAYQTHLTQQQPYDIVHRLRLEDGEIKYVWERCETTLDDQGRPIRSLGIVLDVTRFKLVGEKQAEQELLLQNAMLHQSSDLIAMANDVGEVVFINQGGANLYGADNPADLLGKPIAAFHLAEDSERVLNHYLPQAIATGPVRFENRFRRADGILIDVDQTIFPIRDGDGQIIRMAAVITDIQERKRAERALQQANDLLEQRVQERTRQLEEERNLLRSLIDTVPDYIYVKDMAHGMRLSNIAHAQSVGVEDPAYLVGKTDWDLFPPELAVKFIGDEEKVLKQGQAVVNTEERSLGRDGKPIWALTTKVPLYNVDGEPIGLVGITRNITALKIAQEAVRQSGEKLRLFMEASPIAKLITNRAGQIELVNQQAEALFGYTRAELIGQQIQVLFPEGGLEPDPDQLVDPADGPMLAQPKLVEQLVQRKDGSLFPADVYLNQIETPDDSVIIGHLVDITQRKAAEDAMQGALLKERELGELKSRFVSTASHEFRTPLAAILATSETLATYWPRLSPEQIQDRLGRIREQVQHMTTIMNDVLDLARIQSGSVDFKPVQTDLQALCQSVLEQFGNIHPQNLARIHYAYPGSALDIHCDPRLMRQLLTNLLSNALKYSPEEAVVDLHLGLVGKEVEILVRDRGIGIPPQDLKRIYEPFHRAMNVGGISGTGLGLCISKQVVELHRGHITIDSQVDQGTTVRITLPHPL